MYREYLSTVSHTTDAISQRRKRGQILDGMLRSLFEKKDWLKPEEDEAWQSL